MMHHPEVFVYWLCLCGLCGTCIIYLNGGTVQHGMSSDRSLLSLVLSSLPLLVSIFFSCKREKGIKLSFGNADSVCVCV